MYTYIYLVPVLLFGGLYLMEVGVEGLADYCARASHGFRVLLLGFPYMCVYIYIYMYTYVCVYIYIHYIYIYILIHTMCVYLSLSLSIYIYICVCICIATNNDNDNHNTNADCLLPNLHRVLHSWCQSRASPCGRSESRALARKRSGRRR